MITTKANKFYANMRLEVITSMPQQGYRLVTTNLSYIDAMNYLMYYQQDGMSFKEALNQIERI